MCSFYERESPEWHGKEEVVLRQLWVKFAVRYELTLTPERQKAQWVWLRLVWAQDTQQTAGISCVTFTPLTRGLSVNECATLTHWNTPASSQLLLQRLGIRLSFTCVKSACWGFMWSSHQHWSQRFKRTLFSFVPHWILNVTDVSTFPRDWIDRLNQTIDLFLNPSNKVVMFSPLFVCLTAGLHKSCWTDFHEI